MNKQTARNTKTIKVLVDNHRRELIIKRGNYDPKFGDRMYYLYTAKGEPVGAIVDDGETIAIQRAKAATTPAVFALNDRVVVRKSFDSALTVAARWYGKFH